jgi:hypothetical protein
VLPVLQHALADLGLAPEREASRVAESPLALEGASELAIDGSERRRQRPQDAVAQKRVPPRSVRKLGIRALKPMTDERMCLIKCRIYFFLTNMTYRSQIITQSHSARLNGTFLDML